MTIIYVGELSLFHFDLPALRLLPAIMAGSKNYPESVCRIVAAGNSRAGLALYNKVIKHFVPAHTRQKLHVLGREVRRGCCVELQSASTRDGERAAGQCCVCGSGLTQTGADDDLVATTFS